MFENVLGKLFAGPLLDLLPKLSGEEGEVWLEALKKFLRKENPWMEAQKPVSSLLEAVGTVTVPAIETFRAKEHFEDDRSGPVMVGYIGDNFREVFLSGDGMIEGAVAETTIHVYQLRRGSVDGPIIAELGETVAETTLGQMFEMMRVQGRGQQGNLLTNGYANIFYVRDTNRIVWAVDCYWYSSDGCWDVRASPVTDPVEWRAGSQVISR